MWSTSRRWFVFPVALAALFVTLSAPVASAQWGQRRPDSNDRYGGSGYDNGYRQGVSQGERDARDRRSFDYDRHSAYRSAGGDSRYRDTFRQGFAQGYRDGYYRYANNGRNGGWGNGGYGNGGYGNGGYDNRYPDSGGYGTTRIAYDNGLNDGYREGLDSARDGDRFDPLREKRYRNADAGYNKRYGSKATYQNSYRQGYREGYERAYREASRGRGLWLGWPR